MIALLLADPSHAAGVLVRWCVTFDDAYLDQAGGDFWAGPPPYPGRGMVVEIKDNATGFVMEWVTNDDAPEPGCKWVPMDGESDYRIRTISKASVHGVTIQGLDDNVTPAFHVIEHYATYTPPGVGLVYPPPLPLSGGPGGNLYRQLGVATWAMHRLDFNVSGKTMKVFGTDALGDDCCHANYDGVYASDNRKYIIAHEIGHWYGAVLDEMRPAKFDYNATVGQCNGMDPALTACTNPNGHCQLTREWQSAAGVEGWADFFAAATWNRLDQSDCVYRRQHGLDPDIDFSVNIAANINQTCAGDLMSGAVVGMDDRDWLEDAHTLGLGGCGGTLVNRSTQYDWLRFFWAMATPYGEDLGFPVVADLFDEADPGDWDPAENTGTTADDPIAAMADAAFNMGLTIPFDSQKDHGLDH